MSAHCQVKGRSPGFGNTVSHSHRRSRRRRNPNIQRKTYVLPSEGRVGASRCRSAPRESESLTATGSKPWWRDTTPSHDVMSTFVRNAEMAKKSKMVAQSRRRRRPPARPSAQIRSLPGPSQGDGAPRRTTRRLKLVTP